MLTASGDQAVCFRFGYFVNAIFFSDCVRDRHQQWLQLTSIMINGSQSRRIKWFVLQKGEPFMIIVNVMVPNSGLMTKLAFVLWISIRSVFPENNYLTSRTLSDHIPLYCRRDLYFCDSTIGKFTLLKCSSSCILSDSGARKIVLIKCLI